MHFPQKLRLIKRNEFIMRIMLVLTDHRGKPAQLLNTLVQERAPWSFKSSIGIILITVHARTRILKSCLTLFVYILYKKMRNMCSGTETYANINGNAAFQTVLTRLKVIIWQDRIYSSIHPELTQTNFLLISVSSLQE